MKTLNFFFKKKEIVDILLSFAVMFKSEARRINALVNLPLSHTKQLFLNSTHQFVLILKAPAVKRYENIQSTVMHPDAPGLEY